MATSRELKIYRNSDTKSSIDSIEEENSFEFSISRNNKTIKTQLNCPIQVPIELEKEKKSCKVDLELTLKKTKVCPKNIPKLDLDSLQKKCTDNKVLMYDSEGKIDIGNLLSNITHGKVGFSDLTIDLLKILNDAKDFITKENHRKCFGLVTYNSVTKKIDFYSERDTKLLKVLGSVDLSETVQEVENKIPLIMVNNEYLEIELDL